MGSCHSLYKDLAAAGRFNPSKKTSPPVVGEYGGGAATNGAGMVGESKKAKAVAVVWSPRYGAALSSLRFLFYVSSFGLIVGAFLDLL